MLDSSDSGPTSSSVVVVAQQLSIASEASQRISRSPANKSTFESFHY